MEGEHGHLGVLAVGSASSGHMMLPPRQMAAQVERWHRQRWRHLVVKHEGRIVAEIKHDDHSDGKRIWYAETT